MKRTSVSKKKHTPRKSAATASARTQLLTAGKKLFAKQGLNGTSIRDIANLAGLNSSMISYYFGSKDNLYKECLEEIGGVRLAIAKQVLKPPESKAEFRIHLTLFIESLLSLLLEDKDAGLIIIREFDRIHSPAEKVFKKNFLSVFELMVNFFKGAQKNNLVQKNKDPFWLASLFFGTLMSQMRMDHIKSKSFGRSLIDTKEQNLLKEHLISLFCDR